MKKIGKKLSFMTKVLLVLGLIISNFSSLVVVFADELEADTLPSSEVTTLETDVSGEDETLGEDGKEPESGMVLLTKSATGLEASISEDNKITVIYGTEVNDTDELQIRVTEKYEYNNCETTESLVCEEVINTTQSVNEENRALLLGEGMVFDYTPSLLKNAKFDGKYTLTVTLVNVTQDNSVLDEMVIDEVENKLPSGILFKVYDSSNNLVSESSGKYVFDKSVNTIKVIGTMQPGGISPNDVFIYGEEESATEYSASEFLGLSFEKPINLNGYLYGEFTLPVSILYTQNGEETEVIKNFKISHGVLEDNTKFINSFADSSKFLFEGTTTSGKLYIYLSDTEITLNDIDVPLRDAYFDSENVWYRFSNEELNADTVVTVEDGITQIDYQVVLVGDINDDGVLDENDIVALADQLVGNEELNLDKANIDDSDKEANTRDLLKLSQIVKSGAWGLDISEKEIKLEATLETEDGVTEFVSGTEFDVDYLIVSADEDVAGFAGTVSYDKSVLELVSITESDEYIGSNKDGKFIYTSVGDTTNVKLLTMKFKTLKSGESTIKIDNPEFFNGATYFKIVEENEETGEMEPTTQVISLSVTVTESDDNSLSSLKLGDNEITLEDGKYEYTLTVANDVTSLDVSVLANNSAASVSIVSPEELVEGENTITVTVTSESGIAQDYTIIVTRKSLENNTESNTNNGTNGGTTSQYSGYERSSSSSVKPTQPSKNDGKKDEKPVEDPVKEKSNLPKVIIIVLILLVIAGLIYLIFKDDDDESKKANKDINKFKKEDFDSPREKTTNNSDKKNQNRNNKKG